MIGRRNFILAGLASAATASFATLVSGETPKQNVPSNLEVSNLCPAFCHSCGKHSFATNVVCPACGSEDYSIWLLPEDVRGSLEEMKAYLAERVPRREEQ